MERRRFSELALMKSLLSNAFRKRITRSAQGRFVVLGSRTKAYICRLIKFRVTALRAHRLGTTAPMRLVAVWDCWCNAKCEVRATTPAAMTASKSARRVSLSTWQGKWLSSLNAVAQTAKRLRPLARRALITARPPRVFMRTKKPWVRARRVLEGWYVRFM